MSSPPAVSVLLPFYNASQYLLAAISSILEQTFSDLELLLLDDGSTDGAVQLLSSLKDPRAHYFRSDQNLGLSKQLNLGLAQAKGAYLARMDADDISERTRFEKQLSFLQQHPEIGICSSYAQRFDDRGDRDIWRYPTEPDEVHACILFGAPFLHPGVLMRREVLEGRHAVRYDEGLVVAQDYLLWHQLLKHTKGANLPECLVRYRVSSEQLTTVRAELKRKEGEQIRLSVLEDLGLEPSASDQSLHTSVLGYNWPETPEFFESARKWLETLHRANEKSALFPQSAFARMLAKHFFFQCLCASRRGFPGDQFYSKLSFSSIYSPSFGEKVRIRTKTLLKPAGRGN